MQMQQPDMAPRDFPVISQGERGDDLEPGERDIRVEEVFRAGSGWDFESNTWTFERGEPVGTLYLALARPAENPVRVLITATFEFDDGDVAVLKGVVPYADELRRFGGGRIAMLGGTGKFEGRRSAVPLAVRNPKRWG